MPLLWGVTTQTTARNFIELWEKATNILGELCRPKTDNKKCLLGVSTVGVIQRLTRSDFHSVEFWRLIKLKNTVQ